MAFTQLDTQDYDLPTQPCRPMERSRSRSKSPEVATPLAQTPWKTRRIRQRYRSRSPGRSRSPSPLHAKDRDLIDMTRDVVQVAKSVGVERKPLPGLNRAESPIPVVFSDRSRTPSPRRRPAVPLAAHHDDGKDTKQTAGGPAGASHLRLATSLLRKQGKRGVEASALADALGSKEDMVRVVRSRCTSFPLLIRAV